MVMTNLSERRQLLTYLDADGRLSYIGVWVDEMQIAAAVRTDLDEPLNGPVWQLWSSGLRLRSTLNGREPEAKYAHPLPVTDEHDARAWLDLLADLAEFGPKSVQYR